MMKYLALLAIAAFVSLSMLMSVQPDLFDFMYRIPGRDKSVHFLMSGVLSFLVVTGFSGMVLFSRTVGPAVCLAMTVLLVTFEEFTQLAIPARHFALLDLGYSYAGIAVFGLLGVFMLRLRAQPAH
ncbi:MAG: hypothetical protein RQ736_00340 [Thiogranum sp.]|nr:hypothetical protein [Thiogranum sp.]